MCGCLTGDGFQAVFALVTILYLMKAKQEMTRKQKRGSVPRYSQASALVAHFFGVSKVGRYC